MNYMIKIESEVPSAYKKVNYIQSTGTQYINTGVVPTANVGFDIDLYSEDSGTKAFFGAYKEGGQEFTLTLWNNGTFILGSQTAAIDYTSGKRQQCSYKPFTFKSFNGTETVFNQPSFSMTQPIALFAVNMDGSSYQYSSMRLYSFKIYDGETLIRNYIPCYRKSDNEVGLYDVVNGVFYTNQGSGSFIAGNESYNLPSEYQQVECIESDGTQYINTNYVATSNTKIQTVLHQVGTQNYKGLFGNANSIYLNCYFVLQYGSFSGGMIDGWINIDFEATMTPTSFVRKKIFNSTTQTYTGVATTPSNAPLYLCATNASNLSKVIFYSFKIYENDVIQMDLVPCYRKIDNVVGLYDIINDVFYTNAGTGTFTKGKDISGDVIKSIPIGVLKNKKTPNLLKLNRTEWNSTSYQPTSLVPFDYDKLYYMASSGYIRPKDNSLNETITESSITFTQTSSSWWGIGFPFEVKPNTKYTISAKRDDGDKTKIMYALYDADGSFKSYAQLTTNISILDISLTITTGANTKTMVIVVAGITQGNTVYAYDLQVEEGQTRTQYKPYGYEVSITYNAIKTYNE